MQTAPQRILMLGISPDCAQFVQRLGFETHLAEDLSSVRPALAKGPFDLFLLGLKPPAESGTEHFRKAQALVPHLPLVVVTPSGSEALACSTLQWGAQDYLLAPLTDPALVSGTFRKAIERHRAQETSRRDQLLLEFLMSKIPDAIYFKDTDSRFLRISRAHARRFNLADPALALGKTDAEFFSAEHAQKARADEIRVMQSALPLVGIEEMETWPDGNFSWVSTTKMPLRDAAGNVVGTFGISRDITARKEAEVVLAERTRQLKQKNRQMEEELRMARELQLAMLPHQFPRVPLNGARECALEFFSFYSPTGLVSGDFFDVVELSETAVGLFICDVMGHDVRAALVTAMIRSLVEDLSQTATDPGQLLAQINRGLSTVFRQTGTTMFATALYLIADLAGGELRYASAAHPDALHLRRNHGSVDALGSGNSRKGPALGLFAEALFPTCRRALTAGDMVMLYTDGLIEGESPGKECFTAERLAAAVRRHVQLPPKDLIQQLIADVRAFAGGTVFSDDVSLLSVEVKRLA